MTVFFAHVIFSSQTSGAKTHKPVMFKDTSCELITADVNNDRKFVFIAQDNAVDYRPKSSSPIVNGHHTTLNGHGHHVTNGTPVKKFPWSPEPRKQDAVTVVDVVQSKNYPKATFVTLNNDHDHNVGDQHQAQNGHNGNDSNVDVSAV